MSAPVAMLQAPGDSTRWFVVEQQGIVRVFPNNANATDNDVDVFVDISGMVTFAGEAGLLGTAFHPDFANNGEVFLSYVTGGPPGTSVVSRFTSNDGGQTLDPTTEQIILTIPQDFGNHNGGQLAFGPDGFLYAGWGDGGSGGDPNDRAEDTTNLLGSMTRIDVDGTAPYEVPATNPFAGNAMCPQGFTTTMTDCPEIYAWGLRNPWRWSFDSLTGELWVGDVGQSSWEEIDRVTAGGNYGWDIREGAHCFEPPQGCATAGLIDPITEYDRNAGVSVTGGYVYRGNAIPGLQGQYVYGDFGTGRIWIVPATSQQGAVGTEILDTSISISSFAEDDAGELYVIDYGGAVHQLVPPP